MVGCMEGRCVIGDRWFLISCLQMIVFFSVEGPNFEVQAFKNVFILYEVISGQTINYSKLGTFFSSNVIDETRHEVG